MVGPERSSFPSAPSEPSLRRLGVGGSNGGGDRPLRAQLVVALVAVLILLAVPLYLWRRPSLQEASPAASQSVAVLSASSLPGQLMADAKKPDDRVKLGPVQKVKCSAAARLAGQKGALCDSVPFFEQQLEKAILENVDCAPKTGKPGSVNFVLSVDFTNRRVNVFPGASGGWKGPQARRAAECVERSLPAPAWDKLQHQYRYYNIAIMANYQPPEARDTPMFE